MRPFRFAAIAVHGATAREWREKAREAEALGYDVLLITDHITTQLAPLPALVAAADATTRLRIGSFVFDNDYRNPVMLAKEAATVDLLSDGRLEFGLGAGWNARDYTQLGIMYDKPKVRIDRFAEALALTKRLWTEEKVDHDGTYYRVRRATVHPRPVQRPHPPIMVGGGGPRMLGIAARQADIVAFAPEWKPGGPRPRTMALGSARERIARIRAVAGPRFARLELNVIVFDARVTDLRRSFAEGMSALLGLGGHRRAAHPVLPLRLAPLARRGSPGASRAPRDQLRRPAGAHAAVVRAHRRRAPWKVSARRWHVPCGDR